ncbi:unnamed protein product [Urochloa decumbens]|uniref:BTB domain-containing protein n=1 Tax=Urochloa decumbens TaxID=240449 RepID=A0ABC9BQW7_9POAL
MESGFIELKLDCSEETQNGHAAGRHIHLRSGSKAEQELSINCDLLRRQCSLGDGADVSFLVGGHKFHAHRAVLAAGSPAFRDLLFGPTAAAASMDGIRVEGVKPETFRILLQYMYAGALPGGNEIAGAPTAEMLRNLVAAADACGMERLKLACAQKLSERVSAETVAATLCLAETHDCPELRKKCMDFLAEEENLCSAALSEGYVQLMQSFPSVLDELRARLCSGLQSSDYKDFCSLF